MAIFIILAMVMTSAINYSSGRIDFWAFVQSKTVVLYYYFCGITNL